MRRARKINPGKSLGVTLSPSDIRRLFARIDQDAASGCWLWTGYRDPQGYGQINIGQKARWVHRVVYALLKSRRLTGVEVDHDKDICGHRNCCNPAHLRPMTRGANGAEANRRRAVAAPVECEAPF